MSRARISRLGTLIKSICSSTAPPPTVQSEGYSGAKVLSLLSSFSGLLPTDGSELYAEIGVYRGLTLTNVAASLKQRGTVGVTCVGIDNFSQCDPSRENETRIKELLTTNGLTNVALWNADFEVALRDWKTRFGDAKIGVFFVDGPHDYRSQLLCLLLALPHLAEEAIVVIDDCNYPHVRLATRDFLLIHPEFKLVLEAYTDDHPMNVAEPARAQFLEGWWNGIHVIVRDPNGILATIYPDTGDARAVCEAEHMLQGRVYRRHWLDAVPLLDSSLDGRHQQMLREGRKFADLLKGVAGRKGMIQTLSQDLPAERFNPGIK